MCIRDRASLTTYTYQVNAHNAAGDSAFSNTAAATTDEEVAGSALQVGSIVAGTAGAGKGQKRGTADVLVTDDQGNPVEGALVSGEFTGTFNEVVNDAGPTDGSGVASAQTSGTAKGGVAVTFCVTSITHPTLSDFTAAPGEVCGTNQ